MNTQVAQNSQLQKAEQFRWRTSRGRYISVKEMETRHLFYTIVLIWNHSAPEKAKLTVGNKYTYFSPEYTPAYMLEAFHALTREFWYRNDRHYEQEKTLNEMEVLWRLHEEKMIWHIPLAAL